MICQDQTKFTPECIRQHVICQLEHFCQCEVAVCKPTSRPDRPVLLMMGLATQSQSTTPNVAITNSLGRFFILQIHHLATPLTSISHRAGNQTLLHQTINFGLLVTQNLSEKILKILATARRLQPDWRW